MNYLQSIFRAIGKSCTSLAYIWQMRKQFRLGKRVFFFVFLFVCVLFSGLLISSFKNALGSFSEAVEQEFSEARLYKTASSTFVSEGLSLPYVWQANEGSSEHITVYINTATSTIDEQAFREEYGNKGIGISSSGVFVVDDGFFQFVPAADVAVSPDVNIFVELEKNLQMLGTSKMLMVIFFISLAIIAIILGIRYLFILLLGSYLVKKLVGADYGNIPYIEFVTMGLFALVPIMLVVTFFPLSFWFSFVAYGGIMFFVVKKHVAKK